MVRRTVIFPADEPNPDNSRRATATDSVAIATDSIVARNLSVTFDHLQAIHQINFSVPKSQFVAVVGPSGCGKSTLLRIVAGLQSPTAGTLTIDGKTPQDSAATTGFVFQQPTLLPWRSAANNIGIPLELRNTPTAQRKTQIEITRELVGLKPADMQKLPRMLSGGMQMRVSVARALVTQPNIMLLDEPFGALDDILRGQLNEELVRLWQQQQWTTLFVTHNVAEAVLVSQRVMVMSPAPGRFAAEISIPLPYPREISMRGTSEFAQLVGQVSQALRQSA